MHAQDFEAALELTPFSGCKGESLVPTNPSGLLVRLCRPCGTPARHAAAANSSVQEDAMQLHAK